MKLKIWVLWLCVAALLATEVFLFRAINQKDAALVQLHESQQKAAQLQSDLDKLKNSSVATLSTENARLRADNQGLTQKFSQLQNENNRLRGVNQQLTQQLQTSRDAVQQQQQMQTENQQANPAPEPSAEQSLSAVAQLNLCLNNLRQIDAAKQQWALENDRTANAIPSAQDLLPYFEDGLFPVCPSGGIYTINAVDVPPTCSIPGHVLPQ
jgi:regulator of replication initiation timing